MNPFIRPLVRAAFFVACVSAIAQPGPAFLHPVNAVETADSAPIRRGATRSEVTAALGEPARKLGPSVWVYLRFDGGPAQASSDDCRTLLVTFKEERVVDMSLVNPRAERIIASTLAPSADAPVYVRAAPVGRDH